MAGILLSGPAGGGKSQLARELLRQSNEPWIAADFQAIVAALLLQERGPDGKYPLRPDYVLPLAEYVRQSIISGANTRDLNIVATNSDGDPARRAYLLSLLGSDATERIVDPGYDVVVARLADTVTGDLSVDCGQAINRWYGRRNRG